MKANVDPICSMFTKHGNVALSFGTLGVSPRLIPSGMIKSIIPSFSSRQCYNFMLTHCARFQVFIISCHSLYLGWSIRLLPSCYILWCFHEGDRRYMTECGNCQCQCIRAHRDYCHRVIAGLATEGHSNANKSHPNPVKYRNFGNSRSQWQ